MSEAREQSNVYRIHEQRVHELPRGQQPRELVDELGVQNVQEEVLLAIILTKPKKATGILRSHRIRNRSTRATIVTPCSPDIVGSSVDMRPV